MRDPSDCTPAAACPEDALSRAHRSFVQRAWADSYRAFAQADAARGLEAEELERFATTAFLTGREAEFQQLLERAYGGHVDAGRPLQAARCSFWIGLRLLLRGLAAPASGWLARAGRLVDGQDCVERGYLLIPVAERQLAQGDAEAAQRSAGEAASIGERFGNADLVACGRHQQGRALIRCGQVQAGLALLDEAMLTVVDHELSPIMQGLVYCSVIDACQQVCAFARARQWTDALARWCEQQPDLVAFHGTCLVHLAEIEQLHGHWADAMATATRACRMSSGSADREPPGAALYRRAELHRLRGEFSQAEACYAQAGTLGFEPQPGLALLRLEQGKPGAAVAGARRALAEATDPLERVRVLPALVEILLRAEAAPEALGAVRELEALAQRHRTDALQPMAAQARGAWALAAGDAAAALAALRGAFQAWQSVGAPYEAARVRVLISQACRSLGDEDAFRLERAAAMAVFEQLGARPDLERLAQPDPAAGAKYQLSARELQVLRLVAAGKTNKEIAAELHLSNRTVDRHVGNIFGKLDVPSRAAATAYAWRHQLVP